MNPELAASVKADLQARHGGDPEPAPERPGRLRIRGYPGPEQVFLKTLDRSSADLLACEFEGLEALTATGAVRVPQPLGHGESGHQAWLATEFLELKPASNASDRKLGSRLAELHEHHGRAHGWHRDNHIGAHPQPNGFHSDWANFFAEQRIGFQLDSARRQGAPGSLLRAGERLRAAIPGLLAGHQPEPSLLHGDLWSGNRARLADGTPVIFDPAVHYGDGECDLAMSTLFGRFGDGFYEAYQARRPLPPGWEFRRDLYQLYHVLNHFNLFGGGFARQAETLIQRLLAESG